MKLVQIAIDPDTDGRDDCHKVLEAPADLEMIYVQGTLVHDPEMLAQTLPGSGEGLIALKPVVFGQAAAHVLQR